MPSIPFIGVGGLLCALLIYYSVLRRPAGNEKMAGIAALIEEGAMAFLKKEYKILFFIIVVVFLLFAWKINLETGFAFLGGAVCSILAGFFGMKAATKANVRTTAAARSK